MISIRLLFLFILANGFFMPKSAMAHTQLAYGNKTVISHTNMNDPGKGRFRTLVESLKSKRKTNKLTASILTITLGVFGVHRLYLGTETKIPVLYTATLGGGLGIVPLVDLIFILASKDIERFENDNRFFMWGKDEKEN